MEMASIPALAFLLQFLLMLGALAGIYVAVVTRITKLEVRQDMHEKLQNEQYRKIERKQDEMDKKIDQIIVALENKQNRT
jgi:hypothetical protein